jgi:hypothetical protein
MASTCVSLKKRMFLGREWLWMGLGDMQAAPPSGDVSCSRPGKTSMTSESLSPPPPSPCAPSDSSRYELRVGLNRRRTEGEGTGLGRLGRQLNGGLGDPSCFFLPSPPEVQSRTVWLGASLSLSWSQLGKRCLALRTSSSISWVQLALPEGDPPATEFTLREEEEGESWERPGSCLGAVVGLALREDTLEWRPLRVRCCVFAARVTG